MSGSSKYWFDVLRPQGIISTKPDVSRFANWTKFIFPYCDGALHQGNGDEPVKYRGIDLYFRGSRTVKAHLKWITSNYNLNASKKILFTGSSAGGVAALQWSNYFKAQI